MDVEAKEFRIGVMRLTSEQIETMLQRSAKIDQIPKSCSMNGRYYRILCFYQKRRKEEIESYIANPFIPEPNPYNKIIIGHNTTTWSKADKKQSREILERMKGRYNLNL